MHIYQNVNVQIPVNGFVAQNPAKAVENIGKFK